MSWWTDIRDTVEKFAGGIIPGILSKDDSYQKQMNDQVKAYKEQTELTRQELARKKDEEAVEKRRVDEKQIRALRRNYRPGSMLGSQASSQPDMNAKLGD